MPKENQQALRKAYNFHIPETLHRALRYTSINESKSITDLTREALKHFVKKHKIVIQDPIPKPEKKRTAQVRFTESEYKFIEYIKTVRGEKTPEVMHDIYSEYLIDNGIIRPDGAVQSPLTAQTAD